MRIEFGRVTLASTAEFEGVGIHGGIASLVKVRPGAEGIAFTRSGERFPATPDSVTDTTRSTTLGTVRMVEHLMSAFAALGVTDAEVKVEADEMPILDGGSATYLAGLKASGSAPVGWKSALSLFGRVNLQEGPCRIGVSVGTGRWRYEYDREGSFPGPQVFETRIDQKTYAAEVAPARTFAYEEELEWLRRAGLGKGGTEENTLVIGKDGYRTKHLFTDEAPRHKLLDCMGDIALAGIPLRFLNVVAERTGHKMNVEAAARLVEICEWEI
ncbi:MAG: UDP-3-O-acyl-N-acetylglucosamine deacetylase [Armatimonadetes bacterium]|nr:UDP-3-O-acyl-N-acetylglucosamine deacetylase [Armatimonadota bacterium]